MTQIKISLPTFEPPLWLKLLSVFVDTSLSLTKEELVRSRKEELKIALVKSHVEAKSKIADLYQSAKFKDEANFAVLLNELYQKFRAKLDSLTCNHILEPLYCQGVSEAEMVDSLLPLKIKPKEVQEFFTVRTITRWLYNQQSEPYRLCPLIWLPAVGAYIPHHTIPPKSTIYNLRKKPKGRPLHKFKCKASLRPSPLIIPLKAAITILGVSRGTFYNLKETLGPWFPKQFTQEGHGKRIFFHSQAIHTLKLQLKKRRYKD